MRTGTRRMWARRLLRAGYWFAPVFSAPKRLWKFVMYDSWGDFCIVNLFLTVVVTFFASMLIFVLSTDIHENSTATKEDFVEYMALNQCMKEYVPRVVQNETETVTIQVLKRAKAKCSEAYQLADQKAAVLEIK